MNVLYVAKHGPHDNRDEEAIGECLERYGHDVLRFPEVNGLYAGQLDATCQARWGSSPDLLLTHKWEDVDTFRRVKARCRTFWHFDLITSDDWELKNRNKVRLGWAERMTDACDVGFLTDGDFVATRPNKLVQLMQGADERFAVPTWQPDALKGIDILFTGSTIHGGKRINFVDEMKKEWGDRFVAFGHHPRERVHGLEMSKLIGRAKVVVAPDGPITDRYWSNRVYLALGFGAFLIHPFCEGLDLHYRGGHELVYYASRHVLHSQIRYALDPEHEGWRRQVAEAGWRRTLADHTYFKRVSRLLLEVEKRL